jgi:hypothetical protein
MTLRRTLVVGTVEENAVARLRALRWSDKLYAALLPFF